MFQQVNCNNIDSFCDPIENESSMDLEQIIIYQKDKLKNCQYVNKFWSKLQGKEVDISENEDDTFRQHLPMKLEDFFVECVLKARIHIQMDTPSSLFEKLDYKYICVLIHFTLTELDHEEENNLDAQINASCLYLLLNSLPESESKIFFKDIYTQIIRIFDVLKSTNNKEPALAMLLDDLRVFLMKTKTKLEEEIIYLTLATLQDFTSFNNTTTFETFAIDAIGVYGGNCAYLAFLCLKAIVSQEGPNKLIMANTRLATLLILMTCFKSGAIPLRIQSVYQNNVQNFVQEVLPLLVVDEECLVSKALQVISAKPEYDCYEEMAMLLKVLPYEGFQSFVQWTACAMVSNTQAYRRYLPNLAIFIAKHLPDHIRLSKCEVVIELLTQNIIKLIADNIDSVRENAIRNLEELLKINDVYIKIAIRRIMGREEHLHTLNAKTVLIVLKKHADLQWKKVTLNQQIVNILCHFIILRDDFFLTQQTLELLLGLCLSANPIQLKPCITNLLILIEAYIGIADNVAKAVISIFVHQMKHNSATSKLYTKELWKLIFGEKNVKKNKLLAWGVANILISQNFDYDDIFQKFADEDLLNYELVRTIVNYVHQQDAAWKLLSIMCKYVKFTDWFKIEGIITHCLTTNFFPETTVYMFKSLNHMLKNKSVNSDQEKDSLEMLLTLLNNSFLSLSLPVNCLPVTIELISTMSAMTQSCPTWVEDAISVLNRRVARSLRYIVTKSVNSAAEIERNLVYASELVSSSRTPISDDNLSLLRRIVDPELQDRGLTEFLTRYSVIWTHCLTLYSKAMFVKGEPMSKPASKILEKNLSYADANVQLPALYALYDLCHIYFEYFDPLIPYLFNLLDQKHSTVRLASAKIIMECIEKEQIQLKDGQYLLFMSLIIDPDDEVKSTIQKYMKLNFFVKHERCIAQNFVPSIFYYNHYYEHPIFQLSPSDIRTIQRRRFVHSELSQLYFFLFQNVSKHTQFNIIEQLTQEVLVRALNDLQDYCSRAEKISVFEDALMLIIRTALLFGKITSVDTKEFYEEQVQNEFKKLLDSKASTNLKANYTNYHGILKLVLNTLLKLIGSIDRAYNNMLEFVFRTVILFTKGFFADFKYILNEDNNLRTSVKKFLDFHEQERDQFKYEQKYVPEEMDDFFTMPIDL